MAMTCQAVSDRERQVQTARRRVIVAIDMLHHREGNHQSWKIKVEPTCLQYKFVGIQVQS
jgi:hypothetical protein